MGRLFQSCPRHVAIEGIKAEKDERRIVTYGVGPGIRCVVRRPTC